MAEELKMDLRPKRRPRYKPSDESDLDNVSYSRPNYLKMNAPSYITQYTSPHAILNLNAKLLVKFINKTNKGYRQHVEKNSTMNPQVQHVEAPEKNKVHSQPRQQSKKSVHSHKTGKDEPQKRNKELYNFKGLHQNSNSLKNLETENLFKEFKDIGKYKDLLNNKGIYSVPLSNQLQQLQNLYPNLKEIGYQALIKTANPNLFQFNQNQNSSKQKFNGKSIFTTDQHSKQKDAKSDFSNKVFRRCSYHVAVAYHIFLKNAEKKGQTDKNSIDPTYPAKKIKQEQGRAGKY